MFAPKKEVVKTPMCKTVTGKANGKTYTLEHNMTTKRFSLKKDGELVISSSFPDCMCKAAKHEVEWDEEPKLEFVKTEK